MCKDTKGADGGVLSNLCEAGQLVDGPGVAVEGPGTQDTSTADAHRGGSSTLWVEWHWQGAGSLSWGIRDRDRLLQVHGEMLWLCHSFKRVGGCQLLGTLIQGTSSAPQSGH